jgi:hypothetical protein
LKGSGFKVQGGKSVSDTLPDFLRIFQVTS